MWQMDYTVGTSYIKRLNMMCLNWPHQYLGGKKIHIRKVKYKAEFKKLNKISSF